MKKNKKNKLIYLFLGILVLCLLYLFSYSYKDNDEKYKEENRENKGVRFLLFLNKKELKEKLENNFSFYNRLNDYDLKARRVESVQEYVSGIKNSVKEFTPSQQERIKKCIHEIEMNKEKVQSVLIKEPWVFGCIQGNLYEDGLPHTVDDVILLPCEVIDRIDDKRLMGLILHEKVHVCQRKYPDWVEEYLTKNNIKKIREKVNEDRRRANPDIDGWIYEKNGDIYRGAVYRSNVPFSITDVDLYENDQKNEHPFEEMAIEFSSII